MSVHPLRSRFVMNGGPHQCHHPMCGAVFEGAAYRDKSDNYYCSRACRADNNDEEGPEDAARRVH